MICDPFYLHHIVSANAEIATAIENLGSDEPAYDEKHERLVAISKLIEAAIEREVAQYP